MSEQPSAFQDLIRRLRTGDSNAATELVQTYEKEIRRTIRVRLTDPRLRRTLDSMDICQSVMGNFFLRAASGQFDIETPDQLLRLLMTMARNKLIDKARMEQAGRRDKRMEEGGGDERLVQVAARQDTPSQIVAGQDLLVAARKLLSEEERYLAEQRSQGKGWNELAEELGKGSEALRKQLERAMDRVAQQLGLDGQEG